MRQHYKFVNGLMSVSQPGEPTSVIVFTDPTPEERTELIECWSIDEHDLRSALDPDEIPRIEHDGDLMWMIAKRPMNISLGSRLEFNVSSLGFFYRAGHPLAIVQHEDMNAFEVMKTKIVSSNGPLLLAMINLVTHYLGHLRAITMISSELEKNLHQSLNNQHLISLFALEKSLVYYISAIHGNGVVLNKLKSIAGKRGFSEEEMEKLDDLMIENEQCLRQAEIHSNILSGMMDARASIVNNNLNHLMKQLTILTIVFLPLNVIAGMGGMSEYTKFTTDAYGIPWPVAYGAFTVVLVLVAFFTYWAIKWSGLDGNKAQQMGTKSRSKKKK